MTTKRFAIILITVFAVYAIPASAQGQIFLTNLLGEGEVGEYSTTGALIKSVFFGPINKPVNLTLSDGNLFLAWSDPYVVSEFTTSGATVNLSVAQGLTDSGPLGIAVSGNDLFVADPSNGANTSNGTIGEYTTSGATVNAALVTGLGNTGDLAVSGGDLYVINYGSFNGSNQYIPGSGSISEYTTSGAPVNLALISGLSKPSGLALYNGNLYVGSNSGTNGSTGVIGEYSANTGTPINAALISGVGGAAFTISNGALFTLNLTTVGEYDATTGATINAKLITGLLSVGAAIAVVGNVLPGSGQTIAAAMGPNIVGGAQATFPNVSSAGTFTSTYSVPTTQAQLIADLGTPAVAGINFVLPSGSAIQVWDLGFTGTFTGAVTVTVHFDPMLIGATPPSHLQIYHFTGGSWVPVANEVIDPVADTISFSTNSFSPFMLGVAVPEPSSIVLGGAGAFLLVVFASRRRQLCALHQVSQ